MINCRILFLNGPIHSGKSTIAQMLSKQIADSVYIEGDESVSKSDLTFQQWMVATIMTTTLKACEISHEGKLPIVAYPLRESDWKVILKLCDHAGVKPICVTLDSGLQTTLSKRGDRTLAETEKKRIQEMYDEGYHQRAFSSLVIQNGNESPEQTCLKIQELLNQTTAE